MIRWLGLLTVFNFVAPLPAAEVDHLEFVRGLRARNYPDLAVLYLRDLGQDPRLPDSVKRRLPLETARALLDLAAIEPEPRKQAANYDEARKLLEAVSRANPKAPEAAEADLALARMLAQQAQGRLHKAQLDEGGPRTQELREIRQLFEQAGSRLAESARRLGTGNLEPLKNEAELELAVNHLSHMTTYTGDRDAEKRLAIGKQAMAELKRLAGSDEKNPLAWLARAWLIRYYDEIDSFQEAADLYKRFEKAMATAIEPGRRFARWNYLRLLARKDPQHKDKATLAEVIRIANDWLNDYRRDSHRADGQDVRYWLARAYEHQGEALGSPKTKPASDVLGRAERLYAELEQEGSDYSDRARVHKVQILVKLKPELAEGDLQKLATFSDCFLRAQIESEKIAEEARTAPADPKKVEAQRAKRIENIISVLQRGLERVSPKDSPKAQLDARFLLEYYLLLANKPGEAAELGEKLARENPASSRAGTAGAYALHALAQVLANQERANAAPESGQAARERLQKLAEYIETTWPTDVSADAARHQLGLLALRQKKYPEAIAALGRITPQFGLYGQVQFQLGSAALQAHKEKVGVPVNQPVWEEQAAAAFRRIPEPTNRDPESDRIYIYGKLELAKLEFAARHYDEMESLLAKLGSRVSMDKDAKVQEEQKKALDILLVYAKYGQAEDLFRSGRQERFPKTRALLDPIVSRIQAKQVQGLDSKLVHSVLGLALRASVLDRKPERAKEILELMQKSAGEYENSATILTELGQQLRGQVEELKQKGPRFQEELDETVLRFTEFLDELAKQAPSEAKPEMIRFLAFSYSGLGRHMEAAQLLEKVPPPQKPEDGKFSSVLRLLYIRELRLAGKFDDAEKALRAFLQTEAGKRSLEARKEEAALLEDQSQFAKAANSWKRNMDELKKLRETNPQLAEQYHDCLYHYIFCMYRYAKAGDEATKRKYTVRAAQLLVSLERGDPQMGGLKQRYEELLRREAPLRKEYEAAKKAP
jgi:hypothetical protein